MKTRYLIVIVIAGIIIAVMSAIHFYERPKVGDIAPSFQLKTTEGKDVSLSDYSGKTVFLHFWSSSCGTCLSEIPTMEKFYNEFQHKDFVFLTILVDDDGRNLPEIRKRTPLTYPILMDTEGAVADAYEVWGVPESFFIDRNGIILERTTSKTDYNEARQYLDRLLTH